MSPGRRAARAPRSRLGTKPESAGPAASPSGGAARRAWRTADGQAARPLRFVVIGCGRMGRRRLQALAALPGARVAAVCDADPARAESAGRDFGVPCHTDWRRALRGGADSAIVCVPNRLHAPAALAALRAGLHVFSEKPLAADSREARAMVEAALDSGLTLAVGSNLRRFPNVAEALRLAQGGFLGRLLFARASIGHDGWNLATPWYGDPRMAGGGTFLDNGAHALDLLRQILGEPVECCGMRDTALRATAVEDNAMGVFRSADGRLASLHSSWTDWAGYFRLEVTGERGFARAECRNGSASLETGGSAGRSRTRRFPSSAGSAATEMAEYAAALADGGIHRPSGFDGYRAVRMAEAVYESCRSGRRVRLWEAADRSLLGRVDKCLPSARSPGSTATWIKTAAPSA